MHHNKTLFEFWQKNKHGNCSVFIKTNDDLVNVSYLQMALYGHLVKVGFICTAVQIILSLFAQQASSVWYGFLLYLKLKKISES